MLRAFKQKAENAMSPYETALKNKDISARDLAQAVAAVIESGADSAVLLFMAVEADNLPAVKMLMESNANPTLVVANGQNAVSLAINEEKWEILDYLMTRDFNRTMLFEGISELSPSMIDYLEGKYIKVPHELKNGEDLDWINQIN